jgi:hypothetical protein
MTPESDIIDISPPTRAARRLWAKTLELATVFGADERTLLLAMPIAWKGTVVQYAGRLHRAFPGKRDALIYDYVDAELPVLRRMFAKRLKAYRSLGYEVEEPRSASGAEPMQGVRGGVRTLRSDN